MAQVLAETYESTARMLFKCKGCKTIRHAEYALEVTNTWCQSAAGISRRETTRYLFNGEEHQLRTDAYCAACDQIMAIVPIHGRKSDAPCDARCLGARGGDCECSCAGANHGKAWN